MTAAHHRQDPVAYRRWWERGNQVATASGQRYLQLLAEAHRGLVPGAWDDDDDLIEHHERLQSEIREYGDPMLMFISANTFASVLHHAGHTDRARAVAHSAIDPGRRAGPISHCATLMTSASHRRPQRRRQRSRPREQPLPRHRASPATKASPTKRSQTVFIAAALAARRDDIETAAVLLVRRGTPRRPPRHRRPPPHARLSSPRPSRRRRLHRRPHRRPTTRRSHDARRPHHLHPRHPHLNHTPEGRGHRSRRHGTTRFREPHCLDRVGIILMITARSGRRNRPRLTGV